MLLKRVSATIGVLFLLFVVLTTILVAQYTLRESPRVPTAQSGSLYRFVDVNDGQVRLFVVGDMGREGPAQLQVTNSMERLCIKKRPDGLVFLGDNIYPIGVTSVDDPGWETKLMQYYSGACLRSVPIFALLGNHDYAGNAQVQIDFSEHNNQRTMPFRNYDVSFGDILSLTVTDSWYPDYCFGSGDNCTIDFMLSSLKRNRSTLWRLVAVYYHHRSASSQPNNHSGSIRTSV